MLSSPPLPHPIQFQSRDQRVDVFFLCLTYEKQVWIAWIVWHFISFWSVFHHGNWKFKWILNFFKSFKETLVGNNKSKGRKFRGELWSWQCFYQWYVFTGMSADIISLFAKCWEKCWGNTWNAGKMRGYWIIGGWGEKK